jgi:hypothetical protein
MAQQNRDALDRHAGLEQSDGEGIPQPVRNGVTQALRNSGQVEDLLALRCVRAVIAVRQLQGEPERRMLQHPAHRTAPTLKLEAFDADR